MASLPVSPDFIDRLCRNLKASLTLNASLRDKVASSGTNGLEGGMWDSIMDAHISTLASHQSLLDSILTSVDKSHTSTTSGQLDPRIVELRQVQHNAREMLHGARKTRDVLTRQHAHSNEQQIDRHKHAQQSSAMIETARLSDEPIAQASTVKCETCNGIGKGQQGYDCLVCHVNGKTTTGRHDSPFTSVGKSATHETRHNPATRSSTMHHNGAASHPNVSQPQKPTPHPAPQQRSKRKHSPEPHFPHKVAKVAPLDTQPSRASVQQSAEPTPTAAPPPEPAEQVEFYDLNAELDATLDKAAAEKEWLRRREQGVVEKRKRRSKSSSWEDDEAGRIAVGGEVKRMRLLEGFGNERDDVAGAEAKGTDSEPGARRVGVNGAKRGLGEVELAAREEGEQAMSVAKRARVA